MKIFVTKQRVDQYYLLFPVIEHLNLNPSGKKCIKMAKNLLTFMLVLCWLFSCFFLQLRKILIILCFYGIATPLHENDPSTTALLHPVILCNVFFKFFIEEWIA